MFNSNSPIINNMVVGGMQPMCIPPIPIGNVMGIGNSGYNNMGGYYTGIYNNLYNPHLYKQQIEAKEAKEREEKRRQVDIMKKISKCANASQGIEVDDEYLKRYEQLDIENQDTETSTFYKLVMLDMNGNPYVNTLAMGYVNAHNYLFDKAKEKNPDDTDLFNYLETAGGLYVDALVSEQRRNMDVSKLYNHNDYNRLINLHKDSNPFQNTFNKEINIDDMEITLPNHLKNEYQARRQMFLAGILNK